MLSFSEMGMPWSGPRSKWPLRPRGARSSDSAFLAWARASSAVTVMYALSLGLSRSMRSSMSLVSSTGESFRLRKSFPISSMDAKARSVSFIGATLDHSRRRRPEGRRCSTQILKNLFLAAKISEGAEIGNDQRRAELIIGANRAKSHAAIAQGDAAAAAVVADLDDLVLKRAVRNVVADPGGEVEAPASLGAIADQRTNLVGERLQDGVGLQAEMRDGSEEFLVGFHLKQCADHGDLRKLRIIVEDLLGIVRPARCDFEIADE